MTNTAKLREAISASGYTILFLAKQLEISRYALYLKIEGKNEFNASQISRLAELLKLDRDQVDDIFFAA